MLPPQSLLQDADGDGFPDSLRGTLYLSEPLTLAVVRAAAELTNWLASDALILPLNPRLFSAPQPTIYIGEQPPENLLSTTRGASAALYPDALLLTAATDADLLLGVLHLRHWPLEQVLGLLARNSLSPATCIRLELQSGLVTLHCSKDFGNVPPWDALPSDLRACVTPTARFELVPHRFNPLYLRPLQRCILVLRRHFEVEVSLRVQPTPLRGFREKSASKPLGLTCSASRRGSALKA